MINHFLRKTTSIHENYSFRHFFIPVGKKTNKIFNLNALICNNNLYEFIIITFLISFKIFIDFVKHFF